MNQRVSLKTKLGYGSAALTDAAGYTFISTYFLFFLTTIAGVNPAVAGTIAALGAFWDALVGPLVGFVSDNLHSRYGRRIPIMLLTAFPLAVTTCLMFSQVDMGETGKIIYYGIMTLIFWGSFSTFFIPFMALGAELTTDYHERTVVRSYAYVFNTFGMAVGMALPTVIVDILVNKGSSPAFAWQVVSIMVAAFIFIALIVGCAILKEKNPNFKKKEKKGSINVGKFMTDMVSGYIEVLKLKPLVIIISASILFLIANTANSASRIYFFTYNCGLSGVQVSAVMFFLTLIGIVFAPIILRFSKAFDKRRVLMTGLALTAIVVVIIRFMSPDGLAGAITYCFIFAMGSTCYWQLAPAIIYDVCELDELVNNKRREGTIVSLQSISEAASAAVSLQLLGLILDFAGFDGNAQTQTETTLIWLENVFTLFPVLFIILSLIMVFKYPIHKETFEEIIKQIEVKKEGGTPDLIKLKNIL
jgi:GPH family glycoside/pentoside/hexuronide:cation symporter